MILDSTVRVIAHASISNIVICGDVLGASDLLSHPIAIHHKCYSRHTKRQSGKPNALSTVYLTLKVSEMEDGPSSSDHHHRYFIASHILLRLSRASWCLAARSTCSVVLDSIHYTLHNPAADLHIRTPPCARHPDSIA